MLTVLMRGLSLSISIYICLSNEKKPYTEKESAAVVKRMEETLTRSESPAMEQSGNEASSMAASKQRIIPVCGCGDIMWLYVSNTSENPRRRFWKCCHWNSRQSCRLYLWDDELTENEAGVVVRDGVAGGVAGGVAVRDCIACQYERAKVESRDLKIEKYKLKLGNERAIVRRLVFALFSSWALFLGFFISKI